MMSSERTSPVGIETDSGRQRSAGGADFGAENDDSLLSFIPGSSFDFSNAEARSENRNRATAGGRQEPEGQGMTQPRGRIVTGTENVTVSRPIPVAIGEADLSTTEQNNQSCLVGAPESLQTTRWSSEPRLSEIEPSTPNGQFGFEPFRSPNSEPAAMYPSGSLPLASLYKPFTERQHHPVSFESDPDPLLSLPVKSLQDDMSVLSLVSSSRTYSRLTSASSVSTQARDTTSRIIHQASLPSGAIDYEKLRHLLSEQRKNYKTKLSKEKAKRVALEELLISYGKRKQSERKSRRSSRPSKDNESTNHSRRSSDGSIDSSDLLLELVRRHLRKDKPSRNENERNEASGYSSSRESSGRTPTIPAETSDMKRQLLTENKENFYESTSLFSLPHQPVRAATAGGAANDTLRFGRLSQKDSATSTTPLGPALWQAFPASDHLQPTPSVIKKQIKPPKTLGWWWVSSKGMSSEKMPISLQESLTTRRPTFLQRSANRLRKIKTASYLRQQSSRYARALAQQVAKGERSLEEANQLLKKRSMPPSAFPKKEMIEATKKKVKELPEFRERQLLLQRELEYNTNRICAQMYKQKLAYNVVQRRKVNID